MALDPEDPLIPLPWQMENIRAYRSQRASESEKKQLELEKLRLDLQQKMLETPEGRITQADELYRRMEQQRQLDEGIKMGEVAKIAALDRDMNLLQASKAQGAYDVEKMGLEGRRAAMENILTGGKGLVPVEEYKYQGVSGQAIQGQGAERMSETRRNVFQVDYKDFYDMAKFAGADDQQARQIAIQKSEEKATKSVNKVTIVLPGMGSFTTTPEELNRMRDDPATPKGVKEAIIQQWGSSEQQTASGWLKSRLPNPGK